MLPDKAKDAIAGAAAGVVGTCLGFPLDTVKTTMQVHQLTLGDAFKRIYQQEGMKGFYRGVMSPLVALTILNTINFSSYSHLRAVLSSHCANSDFNVTIAAALVGPIASLISTPFEMVKTQMQLSGTRMKGGVTSGRYRGSLDAASDIVKTHGLRAIYTGHTVNTLREVIFLSTYFTVYEYSKDRLIQIIPPFLSVKVAIPLAGGLSGAIGWFVSFPLDCIKSNIQSKDIEVSKARRETFVEVGRTLFRSKGIHGLYAGIVPSILRAFIVSSSRFSAYEGTLLLLERNI